MNTIDTSQGRWGSDGWGSDTGNQYNNLKSGWVRIETGSQFSAKKVSEDKGNQPIIDITIVPGETTAGEIQIQLDQLGVKYIDPLELERIAGSNKVFDDQELNALDNYLEKSVALSELRKSDIWAFEELTSEKANRNYIQALKTLQKSGIEVNQNIIDFLTQEKAEDKDFLQALIDLQKADIKVGYYEINCLTLEKAKDKAYICALIGLHNSGIKVDGWVIEYIDPKTRDSSYIKQLFDLQKSGININNEFIRWLTPEMARDSAYVEALKDLQKSGVQVDEGLVSYLTLEKAEDSVYVEALKDLQKLGVQVDKWLIYYLTPAKAEDSAYVEAIKDLQKSGIKVDGLIVSNLTPEKAEDSTYIEKIRELKKHTDTGSRDAFLLYLMQVPKDFYKDLKKISFVDSLPLDRIGQYAQGTNKIDIDKGERDAEVCMHELAHLWDNFESNLELSFKKISWSNDCLRRDASPEDFASNYGRTNKDEDFAEIFQNYVVKARTTREIIRKQLSAGKIKLAAKYIYIKYLTPFKGKEYQTELDQPLSIQEVSQSIAEHKIHVPEVVKKILDRARVEESNLKSR